MNNLAQRRHTRKRVRINKFIPKKTSEDSCWYHNSADINVQASEEKIDEARRVSSWSFDHIEYPYNSAQPVNVPWREGKTLYMTPELILLCLYDFNELISALQPSGFRATQRIKLGDSINRSSLILPNPNRVAEGITKDGRRSACCRDAVGKRAYLIVELTHSGLSADSQASVIRHLQELHHGHLQLIVRTEGFAPQAWFKSFGSNSEDWKFMVQAVKLGANPFFWRPEKPARVPNGICRETKVIQECIYWDQSL